MLSSAKLTMVMYVYWNMCYENAYINKRVSAFIKITLHGVKVWS